MTSPVPQQIGQMTVADMVVASTLELAAAHENVRQVREQLERAQLRLAKAQVRHDEWTAVQSRVPTPVTPGGQP